MVQVPPPSDTALAAVEIALRALPNWEYRISEGIARAVDEVVDPIRSGRWRVADLDQPEKTVIGIRVENVLRMELELERGQKLDLRVAGEEVDVKFTMRGSWMIPQEALGHICLLTSFDEQQRSVSAGLLRTDTTALTPGQNQDKKRGVSKAGKARINWLIQNRVPETSIIGFMAAMDEDTRAAVTDSSVAAQKRINRLFLAIKETPIPETVVHAVAQGHQDWTRRLRADASNTNSPEKIGYEVLRQSSYRDRAKVEQLGLPPLRQGYCMSIDA